MKTYLLRAFHVIKTKRGGSWNDNFRDHSPLSNLLFHWFLLTRSSIVTGLGSCHYFCCSFIVFSAYPVSCRENCVPPQQFSDNLYAALGRSDGDDNKRKLNEIDPRSYERNLCNCVKKPEKKMRCSNQTNVGRGFRSSFMIYSIYIIHIHLFHRNIRAYGFLAQLVRSSQRYLEVASPNPVEVSWIY